MPRVKASVRKQILRKAQGDRVSLLGAQVENGITRRVLSAIVNGSGLTLADDLQWQLAYELVSGAIGSQIFGVKILARRRVCP